MTWPVNLVRRIDGGDDDGGGGGAVQPVEAGPLAVAMREVSGAGVVASAFTVDVMNIGGADGVFSGSPLRVGEAVSLPPIWGGRLYPDMAFDATGTIFKILEVR